MSRSTPTSAQARRERRAAARLERQPKVRNQPLRHPAPAWRSPAALVTGAALLLGLVLVFFALPRHQPTGDFLRLPPTAYEPGLARGDVLGSDAAPVVIELYSDFQCPACKAFVTGQLGALTQEFVRPGLVRIEARDIAFLGQGSFDESLELAVGAACAAEQDRYWQFHDLVFWNQGRENRGDHGAAFIGRVADHAELDRAAFDACIARSDLRREIEGTTSAALGAGIQSTPTLIVNGQRVVGVPNYAELAALIRQLAGGGSPAPTGAPAASPS
ncbi:MAG TPA: thioredoxin domain-containing protein [Candidatus Binatia bacterium]|nr:thioredoxin domain-containing protein [Candidatus Binatia bacterium]